VSCDRKKKSVRAKVVFDYITYLLQEGLDLTDADYKTYRDNLLKESETNRLEIKREINSKEG